MLLAENGLTNSIRFNRLHSLHREGRLATRFTALSFSGEGMRSKILNEYVAKQTQQIWIHPARPQEKNSLPYQSLNRVNFGFRRRPF
jgi:hypothetical protein